MTKFPFAAIINGIEVVVWPDWIERSDNPETEARRALTENKRAIEVSAASGTASDRTLHNPNRWK